jgi:hypothetical protein
MYVQIDAEGNVPLSTSVSFNFHFIRSLDSFASPNHLSSFSLFLFIHPHLLSSPSHILSPIHHYISKSYYLIFHEFYEAEKPFNF